MTPNIPVTYTVEIVDDTRYETGPSQVHTFTCGTANKNANVLGGNTSPPVHSIHNNKINIEYIFIENVNPKSWKRGSQPLKWSSLGERKVRLFTRKYIEQMVNKGITHLYVGASVKSNHHFLILIDSRLLAMKNTIKELFCNLKKYVFNGGIKTTRFWRSPLISSGGTIKDKFEISEFVMDKLLHTNTNRNYNTPYQKLYREFRVERDRKRKGEDKGTNEKKRKERNTNNTQGPSQPATKKRSQHTTMTKGTQQNRPLKFYRIAGYNSNNKNSVNHIFVNGSHIEKNRVQNLVNLIKEKNKDIRVHGFTRTENGHIITKSIRNHSKGPQLEWFMLHPNAKNDKTPKYPLFIEPLNRSSDAKRPTYYRGSTKYFGKNTKNENLSHSYLLYHINDTKKHHEFLNTTKNEYFKKREYIPFTTNKYGHLTTLLGKGIPINKGQAGKKASHRTLYKMYPKRGEKGVMFIQEGGFLKNIHTK